jgi:hypothetical protein
VGCRRILDFGGNDRFEDWKNWSLTTDIGRNPAEARSSAFPPALALLDISQCALAQNSGKRIAPRLGQKYAAATAMVAVVAKLPIAGRCKNQTQNSRFNPGLLRKPGGRNRRLAEVRSPLPNSRP